MLLGGDFTRKFKFPFAQLKYLIVIAAKKSLLPVMTNKVTKNVSYLANPELNLDFSRNAIYLHEKAHLSLATPEDQDVFPSQERTGEVATKGKTCTVVVRYLWVATRVGHRLFSLKQSQMSPT